MPTHRLHDAPPPLVMRGQKPPHNPRLALAGLAAPCRAWPRQAAPRPSEPSRAGLRRAALLYGMLAVLAIVVLPSSALAQDRLTSSRPQGFFGSGHAENHEHYQGLLNKQLGSCCNGTDCRPTQARWDPQRGGWDAMVDGVWTFIDNENLVLDDAWMEAQHHPRWDRQAHICSGSGPNARIYCLIPPGSDQ